MGSGRGETCTADFLCHEAGIPEQGGKDAMEIMAAPPRPLPVAWKLVQSGVFAWSTLSAGLPRCGLGPILKAQAFQK